MAAVLVDANVLRHVQHSPLYRNGACFFTTTEHVFAKYLRAGAQMHMPAFPLREGHEFVFTENYIILIRHIYQDGDFIGTVHLQSTLDAFYSQLRKSIAVTLLVIVACSSLSLVLASKSLRVVSRPITNLVEVAGKVSESRDYSLRAEKYAADDLGLLAAAFNDMLHQIQLRDVDLQQEISERKRADASLQQAYAEREQRVKELVEERTAELKEVNERLQREINERLEAEQARSQAETELKAQRTLRMRSDRLRSLGEMAAGIAHELNQPLTGVRGLAELTIMEQEQALGVSDEELRQRLEQIMDQADRMDHIIQHVRMFAREAGKPEQSLVGINDVVESGTELLSGQFRAHGLEIVTDLAAGLLPVLANPYSLEEVLLNLLNNARDALEERRKTGAATDRRVLVRTRMSGGAHPTNVEISVVDAGAGISPDIAAKVFDPFFTTKDPDKGTGLGLAISQSIVAGFGGWLDIDSTPGSGTTVTVFLPTATE